MRSRTFREPGPELERLIRSIRLIAFDFDGVFTDNAVFVFEDGREAVRCVRSDGIGLRKLDRIGVASLIISTEKNPVVTARARKIAIRCIQGCDEKREAIESVVAEAGLTLEQAAFVGNDLNDESCLAAVALPIVTRDAHPDVLRYGRYVTQTRGGYGAVREICDLFEYVWSRNP